MKRIKGKFVYLVLTVLLSCNSKMPSRPESPLATVVKLISAESIANFEEGKKYIDVTKVYSNTTDSVSPEQAWKNQVMFFYNLGNDKKFTNNFKYYDYSISEKENGEKAEVVFEAISPEESIGKIAYSLARYDKKWMVVRIDYTKR